MFLFCVRSQWNHLLNYENIDPWYIFYSIYWARTRWTITRIVKTKQKIYISRYTSQHSLRVIRKRNSSAQITEYREHVIFRNSPQRPNYVIILCSGRIRVESSIVIIGKAGLRAVPAPAGPLRRSHPGAFDNYANVICASGFENDGIH